MADRRPIEPDATVSEPWGSAPPRSAIPVPGMRSRYRFDCVLGKGGMATVHRVTDSVNGRTLALKQLNPNVEPRRRRHIEALFEHEFRTLAQLAHPRVIQVYDYGVDPSGCFYTMELLDGGDLKALSPMPYRKACALMFDVCSSLALLHARGLLHRDVSVRNVRYTKDGEAKLIDFGAMAEMGAHDHVVGTPAFVAPEALAKETLDARSDLYSVGATLYFALTGRAAYPARDFDALLDSWRARPQPPSSFAPEIPPALDTLVLSLVSLDPASRPRTAFEVMERLAACAEIDCAEPLAVLQAYLHAPRLIGRARELEAFTARLSACRNGRGDALWFQGASGVGRTRMLEACALEAKTAGAAVVAVRADTAGVGTFALAQLLVEQLGATLPELASAAADPELAPLFASPDAAQPARALTQLGLARPALQAALARWLSKLARQQALVIAIDDVDRADEASIALLAALAHRAPAQRLLLVCSSELDTGRAQTTPALGLLLGSAERRTLAALSPAQVEELLGSIFGDVPNLQLLGTHIFAATSGHPREAMELLRHLLGHGRIRYERGGWTLPSALVALELPASAEADYRARCDALSRDARFLLEAQALASHAAFTRDDYAALLSESATPDALDRAIAALLARRVAARDGVFFALERPSAARKLAALLSDDDRATRHRALARLYEQKGLGMVALKHALLGGMLQQGFDRLAEVMRSNEDADNLTAATRLSVPEMAAVFEHARLLARSLARPTREVAEIEHWLVMLSTGADERHYLEHAPQWLARLERDSGLEAYRRLADVADAGERLRRALTEANERYLATPEHERCYSPIEAIQFLAHYVAASLAIAGRVNDAALLRSLPELLAPFAPLAPLLEAMRLNALAARESGVHGRTERAAELWREVHKRLEQVEGPHPRVTRFIRNAVAYKIGLIEAASGLDSAERWAELLDGDSLQAVNAMYLRKVVRLSHGDAAAAERFRRQAELLDVQASARPMFTTTLAVELAAHALAKELTGVQQLRDRIRPLAARFPGWLPHLELAEGHYQHLRGNLPGARAALERCIERVRPDGEAAYGLGCWPAATSAYVEVLTELGEAEHARVVGEAALALAGARGIESGLHALARSVALAEVRLGALDAASDRVDKVIAAQRSRGVSGLHLGVSYEVRARIAIAAKDEAGAETYARLTALEYSHGSGSVIAGRYELLLDAAERAGVTALPALSDLRSVPDLTRALSSRLAASALVTREMRGAATASQRAERALRMLCQAEGAISGCLYLFGTDMSLRPVATLGAPELGDRFATWAADYLAGLQTEAEDETAIESDASGSAFDTRPRWTAANGTAVQLLPLRCAAEGRELCLGIAALVTNGRVARPNAHLVAAVSAYLRRAGDDDRHAQAGS